ncbi:MAG: TonB-dependent receptor [Sphingobium sp.]
MGVGRLGVSFVALIAPWSAALAQDAEPAEEQVQNGTIIVAGQFQNSLLNRLPIDPIELPFSVDVIGREEIDERGFFNPFDILETLPNVFRRQTELLPGSGGYNIRGLVASVLTNNRPEGGSRGAGRRDISYIERIEVAKGPSSIILGPVIPGGVINQVTKSPQDQDFVNLTLRGGSYGTYRAEADANIASLFGSSAISFRITAAYEDQQSRQDPEHTETIAIRPVVEFKLGDRTRAQFSVAYTKRDGVPGSRFAVSADGSVPDAIDEKSYFGFPSKQGGEDLYYDAEFQHDFLDNLKLVLRGSYQNADFDYQTSQDATNYAGGRGFYSGGNPADRLAELSYSRGFRDQDVAYADAQLQGNFQAFGQQQDWVIGGSYRWEKFANEWGYGGVLGTVDITNPAAATLIRPNFGAIVLNPFQDFETDLYSIYAEASLRPTDWLTVAAGVRYDENKRNDFLSGQVIRDDDVTFRVGGTFTLTQGLNAYVSYAESFIPQSGRTIRSGQQYTSATALSDPIAPETATNYEVGLKGSLLDNRVKLTAAAFLLKRQNVATADPNNVVGFPSYVIATGEQEHKGFEVSAQVNIVPGLNLDLAYGYVDAKVTKVINPGNGQDVGDTVPLTPTHTFSAYGSYTVPSGPLADLRMGVGVRGISARPAPRFDIDYGGYTLVDVNIGYPLSDVIDVQVNVHNLLNTEYRESVGFDNGNPAAGHRFGNPRSAYLTVRARF